MIEYFKSIKGSLKQVDKLSKSVWVNVIDPDESEIKKLVEEFSLVEENVYDGLDVYEVPRIEEANKKVYAFLRVPFSGSERQTTTLLIVFDGNNIFSISREKNEVVEKIKGGKISLDSRDGLGSFLSLFSYVSRAYNFEVRRIMKAVKSEKRHLGNLKQRDMLSLVLKEDKLNEYLHSFIPLIAIQRQFGKLRNVSLKKSEKEFVEDLIIDLEQTYDSCRSALKSISNMRAYYSATLTNRLNRVITWLTIFTIALTVPTLISSIYGMNVVLPLQESGSVLFVLLGAVLAFYVLLFVIFKKVNLFDF